VVGLSDDEDTVQLRSDKKPVKKLERWSDDPCEFEEYDELADFEDEIGPVNIVPLEMISKDELKKLEGPFVALIRHGCTPYNNMQLFTTGWADPLLAEEGVEDAKNAGHVLKHPCAKVPTECVVDL
jgi:hypothetical protein